MKQLKMPIGVLVLIVVLVLVLGFALPLFGPIRAVVDNLFNRQTFVATGDVVLKRLQEQKTLVAATGTFEVPVVVCNGHPEAYDLQGEPDEDERTPAQQLRDACGGFLDDKATVLASAEVDAVIDLSKLAREDVVVDGKHVTVHLPAIELAEPRIDAETGIATIGKDGSVPLIGGELPDDYQNRAAGAAKDAIAGVADRSGLSEMGIRSARGLFESLLSALGFTEVEVTIEGDETAPRDEASPSPR